MAPQKGHIWAGSPGGVFTGHRGASGSPFLSLGRRQHAGGSLSLDPSAVEAGAAFEHLEEMVQVPLGGAVGEAGGQHRSGELLGTGQVGGTEGNASHILLPGRIWISWMALLC